MKQKILYSVLSIAVCFALVNASAQDKKRYEHFKERTISKTWSAAGTSLDIENSFGKVEVLLSNNNEIKMEVHIEASSSDAGMAEKIFNAITVTEEKKGNTVYFKTATKGKNNGCKNCRSNMSIDYTIHLPASVKLAIDNSFGPVVVPDYSGEISVHSKFGSITAGVLSKVKKLTLEFGSAKIKSMENATGDFKFSTVDIDNISGSSKLKFEFCAVAKIGLAGSLSALTLNESYSTVNLRPAGNLSASYILHTSFGTLINRSAITIDRTDKPDEYGPDSDKHYAGKSGSGAVIIDIKSSFGSIILGEPRPGDIKEKKKKKEKDEEEI